MQMGPHGVIETVKKLSNQNYIYIIFIYLFFYYFYPNDRYILKCQIFIKRNIIKTMKPKRDQVQDVGEADEGHPG